MARKNTDATATETKPRRSTKQTNAELAAEVRQAIKDSKPAKEPKAKKPAKAKKAEPAKTPSTKDIYRVVDSHTNEVVASGFEKKADAKSKRNELNGAAGGGRYIVSRGLDHPAGASNGTVSVRPGRRRRRRVLPMAA